MNTYSHFQLKYNLLMYLSMSCCYSDDNALDDVIGIVAGATVRASVKKPKSLYT